MSPQALTDPAPSPVLGETKARVLELLRAAPGPVAVTDVAAQAGLHANTARFHLEGLVEAELATREREDPGGPGRPRTVYRATGGEAAGGRRSFRLLAEMLTSIITATVEQPVSSAVAAGREWGRYLVERPHPAHRVDLADALSRIRRVLTDAGFGTDPVAEEGGDAVLAIRECPFRELAEQHRDVVCSLHLGLMEGAAAEVRAPVGATALEPFVAPTLCVARLRSTE
jgi:predicted ArsR family transcriptional regulator